MPGRVEEKEDGKEKAVGLARAKELVWRIIGRESKSAWVDQ